MAKFPVGPSRFLAGFHLSGHHFLIALCLRTFGAVSLLALITVPAVATQQSATLSGVVIDSITSTPVSGVSVTLPGTTHEMLTGPDGRFILTGVPQGDHTLLIRAFGFRPRAFNFAITEYRFRTIDVGNITLQEQTFELDDIVVEEEGGLGLVDGFYRRAASGFGTYVTRGDIERRNPIRGTDLLRTIPGVEVHCNRGDCSVSFTRMNRPPGPTLISATAATQMGGLGSQGSKIGAMTDDLGGSAPTGGTLSDDEMCPISYYVDGLPYRGGGIDDFSPRVIEGIELYNGPASTPPVFAKDGASCGVIVVWTRRR